MRRFRPTQGLVGFDFGTKPAFSVALATYGVPIRQQDDGVVQTSLCLKNFTHSVPVLTAGIGACGCVFRGFVPVTNNDAFISITSGNINGAFTANYVEFTGGAYRWVAHTGAVATIVEYDSTDGTCSGAVVSTTDDDVDIDILCVGGGLSLARMYLASGLQLLFSSTSPSPGVPAANQLACLPGQFGGGGTMTVG